MFVSRLEPCWEGRLRSKATLFQALSQEAIASDLIIDRKRRTPKQAGCLVENTMLL